MRRRTFVTRAALATGLTLALAACSKEATPPAGTAAAQNTAAPATAAADSHKTPAAAIETSNPQARKDTCSYITEAEASEILGQPSKYRSRDDSSNCIVDPASGNQLEGLSVDFSVENGDGRYTYLLGKKGEAIDGLGGRAVWSPTFNTLAAVKGSRTVAVTMSSFRKRPDLKEKAVTFAKKVVARL